MNNHTLIASNSEDNKQVLKTGLAFWLDEGATRCRVTRVLKARDYTLKDIAAVNGYSFQSNGRSLDHNQLTRA